MNSYIFFKLVDSFILSQKNYLKSLSPFGDKSPKKDLKVVLFE